MKITSVVTVVVAVAMLAASAAHAQLYKDIVQLNAANAEDCTTTASAGRTVSSSPTMITTVTYSGTTLTCINWHFTLPSGYPAGGDVFGVITWVMQPGGSDTGSVTWRSNIFCVDNGQNYLTKAVNDAAAGYTSTGAVVPNDKINTLTVTSSGFLSETGCNLREEALFELCRVGNADANNETAHLVSVKLFY